MSELKWGLTVQLKTILFPTDFSHTGDAALDLATSLARDNGARVLIVHVEDDDYVGEMYYGIPEPDTGQLKEMLEKVVPSDSNVAHEHRLISGDPAKALVRLANEENVDLIVMGTHGRTGVVRLLMGSVAEAVVRRAPCPVLTYIQQTKEPETS